MTITRSLPLRLLIVLGVLAGFGYLWTTANPYWPYWFRQRQIAQDFGVKIGDYPQAYAFPVGYFRSALKPGMPVSEVHGIVRDYAAVFYCAARNAEVYYYFGDDASRALRFEITYDRDMNFDSLGTEDVNQRTISVDGCLPGLAYQN